MLDDFLKVNRLTAEIIDCKTSVKTAKQAAQVMKVPLSVILNSIVLMDSKNEPVLALVPGNQKADLAKIGGLLGVFGLRIAEPEEVLDNTGYDVGGVPPVSIYGIKTVLDDSFEDHQLVFCGGGNDSHLLKISVKEIKAYAFDLHIGPICQ